MECQDDEEVGHIVSEGCVLLVRIIDFAARNPTRRQKRSEFVEILVRSYACNVSLRDLEGRQYMDLTLGDIERRFQHKRYDHEED